MNTVTKTGLLLAAAVMLRIECPVPDEKGLFDVYVTSQPIFVLGDTIGFQTSDGQAIVATGAWCRILASEVRDHE